MFQHRNVSSVISKGVYLSTAFTEPSTAPSAVGAYLGDSGQEGALRQPNKGGHWLGGPVDAAHVDAEHLCAGSHAAQDGLMRQKPVQLLLGAHTVTAHLTDTPTVS